MYLRLLVWILFFYCSCFSKYSLNLFSDSLASVGVLSSWGNNYCSNLLFLTWFMIIVRYFENVLFLAYFIYFNYFVDDFQIWAAIRSFFVAKACNLDSCICIAIYSNIRILCNDSFSVSVSYFKKSIPVLWLYLNCLEG